MKNLIRSRGIIPRLALVLVVALLYHAYPLFWYSPEVRARVVAVDGKPVANAVVVASWNASARRAGFTHGQVALYEVSTDTDGRFRVPAWGPVFLFEGRVIEDDPTIYIFHPDLAPTIVRNTEVGMHAAWPIIMFRYQDQELMLKPWSTSRDERESELSWLYFDFWTIFKTPPLRAHCSKKYVHRMLTTMREAKLKQLGPGGALSKLDTIGTGENDRPVCFVQEPPD